MDLDALHATIEQQERAVWNALVSGNMQADDHALHADFLGVYADGFADKAAHVQQLRDGPTVRSYRLTDLAVRPLGPDHALISYRADFLRTGGDQAEAMFVSSIWQRIGQRWANVFSQDTPAIA